jgi:hypothetical protein
VPVRQRDRLVPVVEARDAHYRAEGLGVRESIVDANAADDRRVAEQAPLRVLAHETLPRILRGDPPDARRAVDAVMVCDQAQPASASVEALGKEEVGKGET